MNPSNVTLAMFVISLGHFGYRPDLFSSIVVAICGALYGVATFMELRTNKQVAKMVREQEKANEAHQQVIDENINRFVNGLGKFSVHVNNFAARMSLGQPLSKPKKSDFTGDE